MYDLHGFDANEVEPAVGFDPIPTGKYRCIIESSEMKQTKNKLGEYLELVFQVIEGEFGGRKLWSRLNLVNNSAKAVEIARAELSAICRAVGVMKPNIPSDLHNLPLTVSVVCKKRQDTGEMTNEIKGYSPKVRTQSPVATAGGLPPAYQR